MSALLIVSVFLASGDPCAVVPTRSERDPDAARAYAAVAEEQLAVGAMESARTALREALASDPEIAGVRERLAALCFQVLRRERIEAARAALGGERPAEALARLEGLAPEDPEVALLRGMAHLELEQFALATDALRTAEGGEATREPAKLLLGVLALRQGKDRAARRTFSELQGSSDPQIRRALGQLQPWKEQRTALWISTAVFAGYDSNLTLLPDGTPDAISASDGGGHALLALSAQPFGQVGPYLVGSAQLGRQLRLEAFDSTAWFAQTGWRWENVELGYRFQHSAFQSVPYVSAHTGLLAARLTRGAIDVWAEGSVTAEQFFAPVLEGYAGVEEAAQVGGRWRGERVWLHARYRGRHDGAADAWLAALEHGPLLGVSVFPAEVLRFALELSASHRAYLVEDPALGVRRDDLLLGATFSGEVRLFEDLSWMGSFQAHQSQSNVASFRYRRWSVGTGLRLSVGVL